MSVDVDAPKASGWDAADAEAEGWTTEDVIAWAKPRAVAWPAFPGDPEPPQVEEPPPAEPPESAGAEEPPPPPTEKDPTERWPFRVLGYNRGTFFFLPREGQQIVALTATQLERSGNLFALADLNFWE